MLVLCFRVSVFTCISFLVCFTYVEPGSFESLCCLVAKSHQTLLRPPWIVCSPPGSSVHGISPARILKWVAISFSRDFPDPGIKPTSPSLASRFFTSEPPGKPCFDSLEMEIFRTWVPIINSFHCFNVRLPINFFFSPLITPEELAVPLQMV